MWNTEKRLELYDGIGEEESKKIMKKKFSTESVHINQVTTHDSQGYDISAESWGGGVNETLPSWLHNTL